MSSPLAILPIGGKLTEEECWDRSSKSEKVSKLCGFSKRGDKEDKEMPNKKKHQNQEKSGKAYWGGP